MFAKAVSVMWAMLKKGTFKSSFKVNGVVVDGVGYGTATVKGKGGVAVTIEQ